MTEVAALPPANRRARKRRQLTERVAAIAFGLFEEQGFEVVTMEQVAAAADIAKGTLYKYFPVKEALLVHQLQQEQVAGLAPQWALLERQGSFAAQMSQLLQAWAQWHEARRRYLSHYLPYQFAAAMLARRDARPPRPSAARQMLERLCKAGQQRGDVRSDLAAPQLAAMLECLCLSAVASWLARPETGLQHEFDAVLLMALDGVAAHAGAAARPH